MERFWRTLREGCLDHLGALASLHDVNVRLWAFLDQHYHLSPHAALMGRAPGLVFAAWRDAADRDPDPGDTRVLSEQRLRDALTVRERRRVRHDTTVALDGRDWELDQGFLAGRTVTVAHSLFAPDDPPWVEHDGRRYPLHPVDPVRNARRRRVPRRPPAPDAPTPTAPVPFDPPGALLDRAAGRRPRHARTLDPDSSRKEDR
jgi:hypothetical protein